MLDPSGQFASAAELSMVSGLVSMLRGQQLQFGADFVVGHLFADNALVQQGKIVIQAAGAAIAISVVAIAIFRAGGALLRFLRARGVTDDLPGLTRAFQLPSKSAPPNKAAAERMAQLGACYDWDCSDVAGSVYHAADEAGNILEVTPADGKKLTLIEFGRVEKEYVFHHVYTDGTYVYDPKLSTSPVLLDEWRAYIKALNPGSTETTWK